LQKSALHALVHAPPPQAHCPKAASALASVPPLAWSQQSKQASPCWPAQLLGAGVGVGVGVGVVPGAGSPPSGGAVVPVSFLGVGVVFFGVFEPPVMFESASFGSSLNDVSFGIVGAAQATATS